jgi:hypothetical protein
MFSVLFQYSDSLLPENGEQIIHSEVTDALHIYELYIYHRGMLKLYIQLKIGLTNTKRN